MENLSQALATVGALFNTYKAAQEPLDIMSARARRLRDLIDRHQATLEKLNRKRDKAGASITGLNPFINAAYLQPIADAVITRFPGMAVRFWGPQGLASTSSMVVYDPALGDDKGAICWLQFRYDHEDGVVSYVDLKNPTNDYPPNSVGAINGMNYPSVAITPETTLDALVSAFTPCNP
jgi:hypothetical protein